MSTYQKENLKEKLCCVDNTRTITQCMSLHVPDQDFPNSIEGWGRNSPLVEGNWKFYKGNLIIWWWEPEEECDFDNLKLFQS